MYSAHNEEKYIVSERFIRTLKNKIYKYMTSISKNVYIDKLDDINKITHIIAQSKTFCKRLCSKWSGEVFVIKKVKNTVPWTYVINVIAMLLLKRFMKKNYKKQIKQNK